MLLNILLVGLGGSVGAIGRYLLGGYVHQISGQHWFPYGTLSVNLIGCLFIGLVMGLIETKGILSPEARVFILVGVLGSFTTFSTFGYESVELLRESRELSALINIGAHVLLGLLGVWIGLQIAKVF